MAHERFENARCLVTGGAGFIGSNLVRRLLHLGAEVTVLDNLVTGKAANLPSHPRLTLVEADLATVYGLADLVRDARFVFHLAAQVGNLKSIEDATTDASTNVIGSIRLYQSCRDSQVEKVVYSISAALCGQAASLPVAEDHPQRPESFYALSKMAGEHYARLAAELWSVPTVCLRYFNVYGLPMERNEYTGVISIFFEQLRRGQDLTIYGDGSQSRDFVYVSDVVEANLLAALGGSPGEAYNIGSGTRSTIGQLASTMIEITGRDVEVLHAPPRRGEVRDSQADISRAARALGYQPRVELAAGLGEMWNEIVGS